MYIKNDFDFWDLQDKVWAQAEDTLQKIEDNDLENEFMNFLEEYYEDYIPTLTEVNDLLRFEDEFIFEQIGLDDDV